PRKSSATDIIHEERVHTVDVSASTICIDEPAANQNRFGTGERDEEDTFCSRCCGHNSYGTRMENKLGRTEQEGDCRVNPGPSTVVYALLLQRWKTASASVRRLQRRRHLDRSSENTWRCA